MDLFETSWAVHISSLDLRKKSATFSYSTYLFIKCQQRAYDSYERPADIFKPSWDQTDQSNSNTSFPSSTDRAKLSGKVKGIQLEFYICFPIVTGSPKGDMNSSCGVKWSCQCNKDPTSSEYGESTGYGMLALSKHGQLQLTLFKQKDY
jgi:hypothetical protein